MGLLGIVIGVLIALLVGKFLTVDNWGKKIGICVGIPIVICVIWIIVLFAIYENSYFVGAHSTGIILASIAYIITSLITVKKKD